ncbi:MAG: TIGR02281 family clan AA aspartic protease [Rhodobacteraceae bacterium]|nr:TIGR02281 family clan AA aspartic protease [Paracoccaceae bacterium]
MDGNDISRLIYLGLLLAVVGGYFLVANRHQLGKTAQQAAIWGLIFMGAIAVAGLWGDIQEASRPKATILTAEGVEIPVANDGHFYVTAAVNGADIRFVVDTGASDIVLTERDARRVGLDPAGLNFFGRALTANGEVPTAPVRLDSFALGGRTDRDIRASVNGGDLDVSLLGMSYLSRFEMVLTRDRLVLRQ